VDRAQAEPRPAKAGAANLKTLGQPACAALRTRRLTVTRSRSGKSAAPAFAGRGTPSAL